MWCGQVTRLQGNLLDPDHWVIGNNEKEWMRLPWKLVRIHFGWSRGYSRSAGGTGCRAGCPEAEVAAPWVSAGASSFPVSQLPAPAQSTVLAINLPQITPFLLPSCPWTYELKPLQKLHAWFSVVPRGGAICTASQQRKKQTSWVFKKETKTEITQSLKSNDTRALHSISMGFNKNRI